MPDFFPDAARKWDGSLHLSPARPDAPGMRRLTAVCRRLHTLPTKSLGFRLFLFVGMNS